MVATANRLNSAFTSTGEKIFAHQEALRNLKNGKGQPVVAHLMPTDRCQDTCAFCSVQTREGNVLPLADMLAFVDILRGYGLKAVIISGGGNPLLYVCPQTKRGIADLILALHERGIEVGMITNGMKIREYEGGRRSYATLPPAALDCLTWLRVSMSGLDHERQVVEVPDVDSDHTTLGFSYVLHDVYDCPEEPNHGKVSTPADLLKFANVPTAKARIRRVAGEERIPELTRVIRQYVLEYRPRYLRFLPNCLEESKIPDRCAKLQVMADEIDPDVCFVQYKPPRAPKQCLIGYVHPVLNSSGLVFPCDSCVLNEEANHKFDQRWSICHWSEVAQLYEQPVRSLIRDPSKQCPGCVFNSMNTLLLGIRDGEIPIEPLSETPTHANFI